MMFALHHTVSLRNGWRKALQSHSPHTLPHLKFEISLNKFRYCSSYIYSFMSWTLLLVPSTENKPRTASSRLNKSITLNVIHANIMYGGLEYSTVALNADFGVNFITVLPS